jgi:hypothetical protein
MSKIFSFGEFSKSKRVNENTMGQMTLKRNEFDVIVDPQEGGGGGGTGGDGPVEINTGVTEGPGEKPLPKYPNQEKTPVKIPGDKPDQDGGKTPPPSLPNIGDKVILSDGRETIIKRVLPNGDIEV